MIRQSLKAEIRKLYSKGYLAREIKQRLGIDGCIYRLAVKAYWNTRERRRMYERRSRAVCVMREAAGE